MACGTPTPKKKRSDHSDDPLDAVSTRCITGNVITCKAQERNVIDTIRLSLSTISPYTVELHLSATSTFVYEFTKEFDTVSVTIRLDGEPIACCKSLPSSVEVQVKHLLHFVRQFVFNCPNFMFEETEFGGGTAGDSDDEVAPEPSVVVKNPYSHDEYILKAHQLTQLAKAYKDAKLVRFHNYQGKNFVVKFLEFFCISGQDPVYAKSSTNPSGKFQPGNCQVIWETLSKATRQQNSETIRSKPIDRVADVVLQDEDTKFYLVVAEIKSENQSNIVAGPYSLQNFEQVLGLFQPKQDFCMGMVVTPEIVYVNLYLVKEHLLEVFNLANLPLLDELVSMKKLAELVIGLQLLRIALS